MHRTSSRVIDMLKAHSQPRQTITLLTFVICLQLIRWLQCSLLVAVWVCVEPDGYSCLVPNEQYAWQVNRAT